MLYRMGDGVEDLRYLKVGFETFYIELGIWKSCVFVRGNFKYGSNKEVCCSFGFLSIKKKKVIVRCENLKFMLCIGVVWSLSVFREMSVKVDL